MVLSSEKSMPLTISETWQPSTYEKRNVREECAPENTPTSSKPKMTEFKSSNKEIVPETSNPQKLNKYFGDNLFIILNIPTYD